MDIGAGNAAVSGDGEGYGARDRDVTSDSEDRGAMRSKFVRIGAESAFDYQIRRTNQPMSSEIEHF